MPTARSDVGTAPRANFVWDAEGRRAVGAGDVGAGREPHSQPARRQLLTGPPPELAGAGPRATRRGRRFPPATAKVRRAAGRRASKHKKAGLAWACARARVHIHVYARAYRRAPGRVRAAGARPCAWRVCPGPPSRTRRGPRPRGGSGWCIEQGFSTDLSCKPWHGLSTPGTGDG